MITKEQIKAGYYHCPIDEIDYHKDCVDNYQCHEGHELKLETTISNDQITNVTC